MKIEVRFSGTSIAQFGQRIERLGQQADVELQRGLNAAGDRVATQVKRALKDQMGVKAASIINDVVGANRAYVGGPLTYEIVARGKGLPIRDFPVSVSGRGPITADVWGVPHTFQRSFVTSVKGLLRARLEGSGRATRSLFGPSPAKELVKDASERTFEHAVREIVEPVVVARLARMVEID